MSIKGFDNERYNQHDGLIISLTDQINENKKSILDLTDEQVKNVGDISPRLVKAWMIQESGGGGKRSLAAWGKDPLQVNVPGDPFDYKSNLGLTKSLRRNSGDLKTNLRAGIVFMVRKGFGVSGQPPANRPTGFFDGFGDAIRRYNGRTDLINGTKYSVLYRERIFNRFNNINTKYSIKIQ